MKVNNMLKVILFASVLLLAQNCGSSNIKKAQDLIDWGKVSEAIELLNKEIQTNPKSAEAYLVLGNAYFANNMPDKATENYEVALKLKPNWCAAHYILGVLCLNYEPQKAIAELEKACEIQANHLGAHTYLAYVYKEIGKTDKAEEHMKISLRLRPIGNKWVKVQEYSNTIPKTDETYEFEESEEM